VAQGALRAKPDAPGHSLANVTPETPQSRMAKAHEHLEAAKTAPNLKNLYGFAEHLGTMSPEEIKQFRTETGLRGKTADTMAKEALIASQSRSMWQQECRKNGISVAQFKQEAKAIRDAHNEYVSQYNEMVSPEFSARLRDLQENGGDYTKVPLFDEYASEAARKYPEFFPGMKYQATGIGGSGRKQLLAATDSGSYASERYSEILLGGRLEPMRKEESFSQAFDSLMEMKQQNQRLKQESKPTNWAKKPRAELAEAPF